MKLSIQISELREDAQCELTKKKGECVVLRIGDDPEMILLGSELLKQIRLEQLKASKRESGRSGKSASS